MTTTRDKNDDRPREEKKEKREEGGERLLDFLAFDSSKKFLLKKIFLGSGATVEVF